MACSSEHLEGDGLRAAAGRSVRREVERVLPVALEQRDGPGEEQLAEGVAVKPAPAKVVPGVPYLVQCSSVQCSAL